MAGRGFLPPLVTELKGELGDLAKTFAEGEGLAQAYSEKVDSTITEGMASTGKESGKAFHENLSEEMEGTYRDVRGRLRDERGRFVSEGKQWGRSLGDGIDQELKKGSKKTGRRFGTGFIDGFSDLGQSFSRMMVPLLVGGVVAASPVIASLIATAVSVGFTLAFAGFGAVVAYAMLPKVQKAFSSLANPIRKALKGAVSGAFDDALISAVRNFGKYIKPIGAQLRRIFDAVAPLLKPLSDAFGESIKAFLAELTPMFTNIQGPMGTFLKVLPEIAGHMGEFFATITSDPEALSRFISDGANAVVKFLDVSADVLLWLEKAYNWIVKLNEDSPIKFIGFTWIDGMKVAGEGISNWASETWSSISSTVSGWWDKIGEWFSKLPGRVESFVKGIPAKVEAMYHAVLYWIGFAVGSVVRWFMDLPGKASEWWGKMKDKAVEKAGQLKDGVVNLAHRAVDGIVNFFHSAPGRAETEFKNLKTKVIDFFKKAPDWLYNAGKDLIRGLANGIGDMLDWAVDKAKAAGSSIAKGFKDALHIQSPSKLAHKFGGYWMQGFANGMLDSVGLISRAIGLVTSTGGGMYAAGRSGGGGGFAYAVGRNGGYGGEGGDIEVPVYLDGREIARATRKPAQRTKGRSGVSGLG